MPIHGGSSTAHSRWDRLHAAYERDQISYDLWLQDFDSVLQSCRTPIVDLGCGSGSDTKYLIERGKAVIACDYSARASENIRKNFPEVHDALCFDMTGGLPFADGFTDILIADLSLHYFTERVTKAILAEIRRVLTPRGVMLFRLNSHKDVNFGAGQGAEVEKNYFRTEDGRYKRFFDREDICRIFDDWEILRLSEGQTGRFGPTKELWVAMARPRR